MYSQSSGQKIVHIDPIRSLTVSTYHEAESLVQENSYGKLLGILRETLCFFEKFKKESTMDGQVLEDIHRCRIHQTIFLNGQRGSGKTFFLLNMGNWINHCHVQDLKSKFHVLCPIDITGFETERDILPAIIAHLVDDLRDDRSYGQRSGDSLGFGEQDVFTPLEKLAYAISRGENGDEDQGLDAIDTHIRKNTIEQRIHDFLRVLSIKFNKIIILPIDDIDTSPDLSVDIVNIVRKFLTSPYIIPIVAGEINVLSDSIKRQMRKSFPSSEAHVRGSPDRQGDGLGDVALKMTTSYMEKIFPIQRRIDLLPIRHPSVGSRVRIMISQDTPVTLDDIARREKEALYPHFLGLHDRSFVGMDYLETLRTIIYRSASLRRLIDEAPAPAAGEGKRKESLFRIDDRSLLTEMAEFYGMLATARSGQPLPKKQGYDELSAGERRCHVEMTLDRMTLLIRAQLELDDATPKKKRHKIREIVKFHFDKREDLSASNETIFFAGEQENAFVKGQAPYPGSLDEKEKLQVSAETFFVNILMDIVAGTLDENAWGKKFTQTWSKKFTQREHPGNRQTICVPEIDAIMAIVSRFYHDPGVPSYFNFKSDIRGTLGAFVFSMTRMLIRAAVLLENKYPCTEGLFDPTLDHFSDKALESYPIASWLSQHPVAQQAEAYVHPKKGKPDPDLLKAFRLEVRRIRITKTLQDLITRIDLVTMEISQQPPQEMAESMRMQLNISASRKNDIQRMIRYADQRVVNALLYDETSPYFAVAEALRPAHPEEFDALREFMGLSGVWM